MSLNDASVSVFMVIAYFLFKRRGVFKIFSVLGMAFIEYDCKRHVFVAQLEFPDALQMFWKQQALILRIMIFWSRLLHQPTHVYCV